MTTDISRASEDRLLQADAAAARGDFQIARALLEELVVESPSVDIWLKLAGARRALGNGEGAIAAATRALEAEPLSVLALLTRGRLLEVAGRPAPAARDYIHALAQDAEILDNPPQELRALIEHARETAARYREWTASHWDAAIASGAPLDPDRRARIDRFKNNALRRTRVYHSEPSHYHYPGLVEREFHERSDLPWASRIEDLWETIRAEMMALVTSQAAISEPYVQYDSQPLRQWEALNHSLDWTAFHLFKGGQRIAANADRCPATMDVLATLPQPYLSGRGPNAMFSLLKPHTRIPAHHGVSNTRLVCHLPLLVPSDCWFRVGADTREWREGKLIAFDDTIEHEAANDSDQPRVVLIFDIWHPGLDELERAAITRVMEADERLDGATL